MLRSALWWACAWAALAGFALGLLVQATLEGDSIDVLWFLVATGLAAWRSGHYALGLRDVLRAVEDRMRRVG